MAEKYESCSSWAEVGCEFVSGKAAASSFLSLLRISGLASISNVRFARVEAANS